MSAIDVVIPAFNAEAYLGEAVGSVVAQHYAVRRIIVVDDGSTDATPAVAASLAPQLEVVRQDNHGSAAARNAGVALSDATLIAFLDADDRWAADKLVRQAAAFAADPALDFVLCRARAFATPELAAAERSALEAQQPLPFEAWIASALLIRRSSFDEVGMFATDLRVGETIDWFSRARRAGLRSLVLPEILLERRLHRNNTTRLATAGSRGYLIAAKRHLERTRRDREGGHR